MLPRWTVRVVVVLMFLVVPHSSGQRGQWSSRSSRGANRLSLSALDTLSSNDLASLLQRAEMREYRSGKRGGASRYSALLDVGSGLASMPPLRGMRSSSLSSLRDRYLDTGMSSLGLDGRRMDSGMGSSYLFDRYDILSGGSRGSMQAAQRDFFMGGGSGVGGGGRGSGLAELASAGRRGDMNLFQQPQTPGLQGSSPSLMRGSNDFNRFSGFGQSSFMGGGQQQFVPQQPQMSLQQSQIQQQQAQLQTPQIVIQTQPQQQPAQIVSPIASTTSFSGSVPVSTVVQSLPVQFQQVQQVPINTVVQPTSFVLQQTPVVGVATQPQTTTILQAVAPHVVHQRPAAAATTNGFRGVSGMGSGLGVRPPGPFSGMAPVIVKIEDMFPQSQHPTGSELSASSGQEGTGASKSLTMGYNGDPNLSVMKLDEGLQVVINHSDPQKRIVNFPTPTNEAEAKALKKILEKAEAPDFIRELVQVQPMMAEAAGMPTTGSATIANTAAAAATASAAATSLAQQQQNAAAMSAAANAAAAQAAAVSAAAAMNAAVSGTAGTPQVSTITGAGGAPAGIPVAATSAGVAVGTPGMILDKSDMPIDEILSGLFAVPQAGPASASFPMASSHPRVNGRFVLTALDMELTPQQFAELHPSAAAASGGHTFQRVKRKALVNQRARWAGGVIPFEINPGDFSGADQQRIMAAMSQWSATTCIQFRQAAPSDANKLVLKSGRGCSSNVGMIGGTQYLTLQKECRIPKILLHELGHAIGLIHEHQREDRDNYLKIHYSNIKPGGIKDFDLFKRGSVEHGYAAYDYMSIMHYGKAAFSRDGKSVTMQAVDPKFTNFMGTASTLSQSDITTVNSMYGCGGGMGGSMSSMGGMGGAIPSLSGLAGMMPLAAEAAGATALGGAGLGVAPASGAAAALSSGGTIVTAPMVVPPGAVGATGGTIVTQPMVAPQAGGAAPTNTIIAPPMVVPQTGAGSGGTIVTSPIVVAPSGPNTAQVTGAGSGIQPIITRAGGPQMVPKTGPQTGASMGKPQIVVQVGRGAQGGGQTGNMRGQEMVNTVGPQAQKQLGANMGQQQLVKQISGRVGGVRVGQQTANQQQIGQTQMGQGQMLRNQKGQQMSAVGNGGSAFGGSLQGNFGQGYQIQAGNVGPSQLQQMVATSAQQSRSGQVVRG